MHVGCQTPIMSHNRVPVVWHIDDNQADLELVALALAESAQPISLRSFSNAALALDDLAVVGTDALPDLLLLDVNMPGMGGVEFLRMVQNEPRLHQLRIAILTGAIIPPGHDFLKILGASCVLKKPALVQEFPALRAAVLAALAGAIQPASVAMHQQG